MARSKSKKAILREKYTNLAFLIMAFQVDWQRYYFSDGHNSFRRNIKDAAKSLVSYMRGMHDVDPQLFNSKSLLINNNDSEDTVNSLLRALDEWTTNNDVFPAINGQEGAESFSFSFKLFYLFEISYLSGKLGLENPPALSFSTKEGELHSAHIKWIGHVNYRVLGLINDNFLKTISKSDSIVIVADIRHSQDLMTYSPTQDLYERYILKLSEEAQKIIKEEYGIFDRFTGDGFICYFNKYVSQKFKLDYYDSAYAACRRIKEVSRAILSEWIKQIRKVPADPIGLAFGIDTGSISYTEKEGNLYAIGDACVWATRMCSAGGAGDIVVNNIPYQNMLSRLPVDFHEIITSTKDGEKFCAHIIDDTEKSYIIEQVNA